MSYWSKLSAHVRRQLQLEPDLAKLQIELSINFKHSNGTSFPFPDEARRPVDAVVLLPSRAPEDEHRRDS